MTNAEARFNIALRPRKPEGSLGRTAQDGHLDSHTAPELCEIISSLLQIPFMFALLSIKLMLVTSLMYDSGRILI